MPLNLPNLLTWLRILFIPLMAGVFYLPDGWVTASEANLLAAVFFGVAALTDWLDGYLARALGPTSAFGAFLDPVADKLMVAAALIVLIDLDRVAPLIALIVIGREITISALREWMAKAGKSASVAVSLLPEEAYGEIQSALLGSARGEKETRIRRRALESLGWSSNPEVVELIESAFERENTDWKVSALIAMGRSADDRWEDRVLRSMLDDNEKIRKAAVQSAGMLAFKSARLPLLRMLESEESDEVMNAAIWSLSQIGGEDVQIILEQLLDETEDEDLTLFLEEALDNLAFTEDLDRFELMAFDPDELDDLEELDEEEEA